LYETILDETEIKVLGKMFAVYLLTYFLMSYRKGAQTEDIFSVKEIVWSSQNYQRCAVKL